MIQKNRFAVGFPAALALALAVTVTTDRPAEAQLLLSDPYLALYAGQSRTNYTRGPLSQELDWRKAYSVEAGFNLMGLTISPGFMQMGRAEWTSDDGNETFELEFSSLYLNVGAREEIGLYFAGGLNWTFWDVLPRSNTPGVPSIAADSEIGFQAFLGFTFGMERLPIRFMIEAGYAQFSGNVNTPGVDFVTRDLSSTGPLVRVGVALAK